MPNIFLESHNIDNQYFGFGQFNKQLIAALHKEIEDLEKDSISFENLLKQAMNYLDNK